MKLREVGTIILVIFVSVCGLYTIAHKVKKGWVKEDNFVEEYIEDIIEDRTGLEVDLTPEDETGGFFQSADWERIQEFFRDNEED